MAVKWVWICQRQAYYFYLLGSKNCSGLQPQSRAKELDFSCFTLSFRAGIYGTKTGMVSRKMKLVIFTCLSAKLQRRFAAREYCSGASPPGGFLWGSAPNPARFFEKSVGKIMFCRKVSHSFHSCDTWRLFLFKT